jgi:heme exporter protein D
VLIVVGAVVEVVILMVFVVVVLWMLSLLRLNMCLAGMRSRCARPDRVRKTICHIAGRFETRSAGVENGSSGTR